MRRKLTVGMIRKIKEEVLNGKTKYQVAVEWNLPCQLVYYHTRDLPSTSPGRSEIRGTTLQFLKQLLQDGFIVGTARSSGQFRTLRKHFPSIHRAEVNHHTIYYLTGKDKEAIQALLHEKRSRIVNYADLAEIAKTIGVSLSSDEKKGFLGKKKPQRKWKIHEPEVRYQSVPKEKQRKIDDFLGIFWHSEQLRWIPL